MDDSLRILMVEFAATRGFHRAEWFPFIQGRLRQHHRTRWIRFGVDPANLLRFEATGVDLENLDTGTLQRELDDLQPTHLLFSLRPAPALLRRLAWPQAGCVLRHAGPDAPAPDGDDATPPTPPVPCMWAPDAPFPDAAHNVGAMAHLAGAVPDYAWIPGNEAARTTNPLPYVIAGDPCLYNRPFTASPFLRELDLRDCVRSGGCAFCMRPPGEPAAWSDVDPVEAVRMQLEAIARTCPTHGHRLMIRMQGEAPIRHIGAVADRVARSALPGADLLLDCRSDMLVHRFDALRDALPALRGTAHRIEMCLVGIENFCTRELTRLNKGFAAVTNLRALRCLFLLERESPEQFGFRTHGGLSLITLTPWTRPEELVLNLSVCRLLGIDPIAGKLLSGRLRLYPALPLHARARADGLLATAYDDPLLDTARLNLYAPESPWRFADPVMAPLGRVLLRMDNDRVPPGFDPLTDQVAALVQAGREAGISTTTMARHLAQMVVVQTASGPMPSAEDLVLAGHDYIRAPGPADPANEPPAPTPEAFTNPPPDQVAAPLPCILDEKPVSKVEPIPAAQVDAWRASSDLPHLRLVPRPDPSGDPEVWEAFFGRNPEDVAAAIDATLRLRDPTTAPDDRPDLVARVGRLLGYPPCCADAMAREDGPLQDSTFWMHIARRVDTPGAVPHELHPASIGMEYIPCTAACPDALARSRRILEALAQADPRAHAAHVARLHHPFLLFSDEQGAMVELVPQDEPGDRFRFRAGRIALPTALAEAVRQADELVLDDECLLLLRQGRPFLPLSGHAFLWWHRQAFQADFWQAMVQARRANARPDTFDAPASRQVEATPELDDAALRATSFLERLFEQVRQGDTRFAGYRLTESGVARPGQVGVLLEGGDGPLRVIVDVRNGDGPCLIRIGRMALRHPEDAPIRTPTQWRGFRAFHQFLARVLAGRRPPPRT